MNFLNLFTGGKRQEREEIDHLLAVCKMVNLRRRIDKRLKGEKDAWHWPAYKVLQTTEALIANAAEFCEFLRADGYTELESVKKITAFTGQPLPANVDTDLTAYLRLRLQAEDPEYLSLKDDLFTQALAIARNAARYEIAKRQSEQPFPPVEWLGDAIAHSDVDNHASQLHATTLDGEKEVISAPVPRSREWVRMKLRLKPDDEIRSFSGYLIPGYGLSYRAGIALVRQGVPIEHVITIRS